MTGLRRSRAYVEVGWVWLVFVERGVAWIWV